MSTSAAVRPPREAPYVGPRPFEEGDADRFFARDHAIQNLVSLIIASRIVIVYAASGAGKSSLLNAGVIPALRQKEGIEVLPVARVWGGLALRLHHQLSNVYVFNVLSGWADKTRLDASTLVDKRFADLFRYIPQTASRQPISRILIVDQFEELFTSYPERWEDRAGFFKDLTDSLVLDPYMRVVLSMREDYIARMDSYQHLLPLKGISRFYLEPLREAEALDAIRRPLEGTGISFAPDVAETLVDQMLQQTSALPNGNTAVKGEFVEPVQLQVVSQHLWNTLAPTETVITQEHLNRLGGIGQALSNYYESVVAQASTAASVPEAQIRQFLQEHLITPYRTRGIMLKGPDRTGNLPNAALKVLEDMHLIRSQWRANAIWVELSHDQFIAPILAANQHWFQTTQAAQMRRLRLLALSVPLLLGALLLAYFLFGPDIPLQPPPDAQIAWSALGPEGYSILQIVPSPDDPETLYTVVDAHGLYISTDGGRTWQPEGEGSVDKAVMSLAIDEDGEHLYAGTVAHGIQHSEDAGHTWQDLMPEQGARVPVFIPLLITGLDGSLYAGGEDLYHSDDGGQTWEPLTFDLPRSLLMTSLLIDPDDPQTLYLGTTGGVYRSSDGGAAWKQISAFDTSALSFGAESSAIYAGGIGGLYQTNDSGTHWTWNVHAQPDGLFQVRRLVWHEDRLYIAANGGLYVTEDGSTWERLTASLTSDGFVVRDLALLGDRLLIGTGRGLYESDDRGNNWERLTSGLPSGAVIAKSLALDPTGQQMYVSTWGDGIHASPDGGQSWQAASAGAIDPYGVGITSTAERLYVTTWERVFTSSDQGESWRAVWQSAPRSAAAADSAGETLYVVTYPTAESQDEIDPLRSQPQQLARSTDGGETWDVVQALSDYDLTIVSVNPHDGEDVYVGTQRSGVIRSTDGGETWQPFDLGIRGLTVNVLTWAGANQDVLFAATSGGLYRAEIDGPWERLAQGNFSTIASAPHEPERIYAASHLGVVYLSDDLGVSWRGVDVPYNINQLIADSDDSDIIYAATEGQGVTRGDASALLPRSLKTPITLGMGALLAVIEIGILLVLYSGRRTSPQ